MPETHQDPETVKPGLSEILGSVLCLLGFILSLAVFSYSNQHNLEPGAVSNWTGVFGHYTALSLVVLFGYAAYLLGPSMIFLGIRGLMRRKLEYYLPGLLGTITVILSLSLLIHFFSGGSAADSGDSPGGVIGHRFGQVLIYLFGTYGALLVALAIFIPGLLYVVRLPLPVFLQLTGDQIRKAKENSGSFLGMLLRFIPEHYIKNKLTVPNEQKQKDAEVGIKQYVERLKEKMQPSDVPWIEKRTISGSEIFPSGNDELQQAYDEHEEPDIPQPALYTEIESDSGENPVHPFEAPAAFSFKRSEPFVNQDSSASRPATRVPIRGSFDSSGRSFTFHKSAETGRFRADKRVIRLEKGERLGNIGVADYGISNTYSRRDDSEQIRIQSGVNQAATAVTEREEVFHIDEPDTDSSLKQFPENPESTESPESYGNPQEMQWTDESDYCTQDNREEAVELTTDVYEPEELSGFRSQAPSVSEKAPDETEGIPASSGSFDRYKLPLTILNFSDRPEKTDVSREIQEIKEKLEKVMQDFGIQASVVAATRGPMITQYEVSLEPGVRVNRIIRIHDEIRMNLAAHSVRIVAPIPGKSTIGIEIPNRNREEVTLGDIARKDQDFFSQNRDLGIALGKDIAGRNVYVDLAKLPHLLIAGATGAGKSVYMNSLIASILYNHSPEEVRFLMIDPKMVELKLYEGIPHLLYPVITDVRKASRALNWAVSEMERRYQLLSQRKCRDIRSFNQRVKDGTIHHDPLPYAVLLIDELSDLMMVAAKDVEDSIIRLTQKARAVGIHVIMATQRPSVDVITALIKANCPARIAFQVAQKTDARVILDNNGAESLLGRGDMLYKSPSRAGLERLQSPMITEREIEDIVKAARKFGEPGYVELPGDDMESETELSQDVDADLLSEAWRIILESGKTSTSYVQRRLRIGYNRAANIIENLEEMGYLGPAVGNRPREILKKS